MIIYPSEPHKNGTDGHWETILVETDKMVGSGEYDKIYINKGLSQEISPTPSSNNIPDIMGVRTDGLIDQVEVPSKTDKRKDLDARLDLNIKFLGNRAGGKKIEHVNLKCIDEVKNGKISLKKYSK